MDDDSIPWTKKYAPTKLNELVGLDYQISELKRLVQSFKKGKGILLYGGTGGGKTSAVYALSQELGLELVEINASDTRNADGIDGVLGGAIKQSSLFFRSKLILVDEADGLAGREDRGGVPAIVRIIESSPYPVILTTNDPYEAKLSSLRKKCVLVEFKQRPHTIMAGFLNKLCEKESISCDEEALSMISRRANGDLRAAINDLQSLSAASKRISREDIEHLSDRERTESIISALIKIFKTTDPSLAVSAFDSVDEDLEEIFLWVEENLPREYLKPADLARGFEALSQADLFKGRIMRWQHYRFYVYCYNFLSAGIAVAKEEKYKGMVQYKPTGRILKLWIAKQKNLKKKAIAEKIAAKTHVSKKRALQDTLPFLKAIFKSNKLESDKLTRFFELDPEQVEWLSH